MSHIFSDLYRHITLQSRLTCFLDVWNDLSHDAVKHCGKLRTNTKYRQEEGSALLAGIVPILELKKECSALDIRTLLWSGSPNALPAGQKSVRFATCLGKHDIAL